MATNCTFEFHVCAADGRSDKVSGTVALNDVVVNTTVKSDGTFNTATVNADKQQAINLGATDAASAGVPQGWYTAVGGATFRRRVNGQVGGAQV